MSSVSVDRTDWAEVVRVFTTFFDGRGEVLSEPESVSFRSGRIGTGLELRADGGSSSFMPLHDLQAQWDAVSFDEAADTVVLYGSGATYTYRVPPALRR